MVPLKKSIIRYGIWLVLIYSLLIQSNVLFNQFAYDDALVLTHNSLVQKGITSTPQLFKTTLFSGFTGQLAPLAGDRYRPIVLASFALEYSLWGFNPFLSHLVNLILFLVCLYLLHLLLSKNFSSFLSTIGVSVALVLFAVHPIHTEVIANVKSRDELLAFLFILLAWILYWNNKSGTSLVLFFLALLTKESSVTYIGVIGIFDYCIKEYKIAEIVRNSLKLIGVLTVYVAFRYLMIGIHVHSVIDIGNSPYSLATPLQGFCTKTMILFDYLKLLIWPYPLCYDYGFNQIPFVDLTSNTFWLAFIILLFLLGLAIWNLRANRFLAAIISYFFITISVGTNFFFDLGAILAERMLFIPSLAICLAAGVAVDRVMKFKASYFTYFLGGSLGIVLLVFSGLTVIRNTIWKDNESLFLHDVIISPNSIRTNQNAAKVYLIKAFSLPNGADRAKNLQLAAKYDSSALTILPGNHYIEIELDSIRVYIEQCKKNNGGNL